jgi:small subunit ribosomal protein S16
VAVKIRLKRMGKIRAPFYRVVVMDSRTKRDGRAIEEIGKYHPTAEPSVIEIDSDRAQHWLTNGAQPTEAVAALLKVTGDWQRFKGLPGAEGTLKIAAPAKSKKELYEAAVAAAGGASLDVKDTPTRKRAEKSAPAAKSAEPAGAKSAPAAEKSAPAAEKSAAAAEKSAPATTSAEPAPSGSAAAVGSDSEPSAGDNEPVPADTEAGDASVSGNPAEDPDPAPGNTEE